MQIKQFNFFRFVKVYREIVMVKTVTLKNFIFYIKSLISKKKKLALTWFY